MPNKTLPTEEELIALFAQVSNEGRWGPEDERGMLNAVTPEKRVQAGALVKEGVTVALGNDLDPSNADPLGRHTELSLEMQLHFPPHEETRFDRFSAVRETINMICHGSPTHLDAFSHVSWDGKLYNGFPRSSLKTTGATKVDVANAREGFVTRGVLLDVAAARGVKWFDPGEGVFPEDIEAAEERQGVRLEEGDACILYTGNFRRIAEEGLHEQLWSSGYNAACIPWLKERGPVLISSDSINDVCPSGYIPTEAMTREVMEAHPKGTFDLAWPVHIACLAFIGIWVVDNMQLEELAATCERLKRWEFFFVMAPQRFLGSSGSQVNPIAVF
jgi:kynurenine formamidase